MNCPKCNTPNPPEAKFCRNCGANIVSPEAQAISDNKSIKALLIIIGIDYLLSTVMFILQKLALPYLSSNGNISQIDLIYKVYGWTSDFVSLTAMLFFLITIKNNTVKTALMVFIILRFIIMIGYRVFPLLSI
jgi:hypothetical protein